VKEKEEFKIFKEVFDTATMKTIAKLASDGYIDYMLGIISTGKEANVYLAKDPAGNSLAVKVYRMETSEFQHMYKYIQGDRRFESAKRQKRDIVLIWAKKEFKNLETANSIGVRVPKPIIVSRNVLLMEFIGEGEIAAPIAKDKPPREPKIWLQKILNSIKALYQKASLIHGDLSEYNLLNLREEPVLIDIGQGVPADHPIADELLRKDIENTVKWFKKLGATVPDPKDIYNEVTGKR
jgi:RIO kinase 1